MKNHLKVFSSLLALLLLVSLGVFPTATVVADQNSQDKTRDFMENMLPIDLSKYTINLIYDTTLDGVPLSNDNRKINTLRYELNSENSKLRVGFIVENDVIW
ncbi:MAG: hypothetical protein LBI09_01085, partial [Nitrososphaerota archaeon]|nr:hypothetical protein [Nitrososphaerota archaeon]